MQYIRVVFNNSFNKKSQKYTSGCFQLRPRDNGKLFLFGKTCIDSKSDKICNFLSSGNRFTPPLKYLLITIDNTVLDKFECELQEDVNCHYSIKIKNYNEIFIDQHNNTLASLYEELCTKNTPQVYECKN